MKLILRQLGLQDYESTWQKMRDFTDQRIAGSTSELWLLEHPPVFTQGQAGKAEHILNRSEIPIRQTDRGGQVTYHGPGQLILYILLDLKASKIGIRKLVTLMENAVIHLLDTQGIKAQARKEAPGVYINNDKIASLGLRVRRGFSYHGLAVNVDMDLSPFKQINPCGLTDIGLTQLSHLGVMLSIEEAGRILSQYLAEQLNYQLEIRCD